MICKNCGTEVDFSKADAEGIVTCPGCGKKYRLKAQPQVPAEEVTPEEAAATRQVTIPQQKVAPAGLTKEKRNMYIMMAACAVLVIALVIVLIVTLGGKDDTKDSAKNAFGSSQAGIADANTPAELIALYDRAMNGNTEAAWHMISPSDRKEDYDNDYSRFKQEFERQFESMYAYVDGALSFKITFEKYEKVSEYSAGYYFDNRTEEGTVTFRAVVEYQGQTETMTVDESIMKIDGKWYIVDSF